MGALSLWTKIVVFDIKLKKMRSECYLFLKFIVIDIKFKKMRSECCHGVIDMLTVVDC
jgi:hypothetical protein